jgi:organic radical activating enzyme
VAEEKFADLGEFKEVFGRFVELLGSRYDGGLHIFGGEPLLHPQIEEFLAAARELLPTGGWITIITNGIQLKDMPESFWVACARYKADLCLSGYPINIDISKIQKLAETYDVRVSISSRDERAWSQYVLDLDGNQEIKRSFSLCENANERFILKGRYLYPCSVTACIEHFNKAFGRELSLCSEDYLDILSDITAQDILNFIATPVPFCRYCNREKLKLGESWRLSTCDISEYLE